MPEIEFLLGLYGYFSSRDQGEPLHVHVAPKEFIGTAKTAKIWIREDRSNKLAYNRAGISTKKIKIIQSMLQTEVIFHKTVDLYIKFFEPENGKVNFYKKKDIEI